MTGHRAMPRLALPARAGAAPVSRAVTGFPRCSLVPAGSGQRLRRRALLAGARAGGGGVHSSYLCLPEHVEEPGVASVIRRQFTEWARLQAGGPSGGEQPQWAQGKRLHW